MEAVVHAIKVQEEVVRKFVPKFKVIVKEDSKFHAFLGFLLKLIRINYSKFWTTIGYTAAGPREIAGSWMTIIHEGRHAQQSKKYTRVLMGLLYLLPQALAPVFIVAAFYNLWFLVGLVCLAPIPAYFRMKFELDAYKISVMLRQWYFGANRGYSEFYTRQFTGGNYFFMWPFATYIRKELKKAARAAALWKRTPVDERDPYINAAFNYMLRYELLHEDAFTLPA